MTPELAIRAARAAFNRAIAEADLTAIGAVLTHNAVLVTGTDSAVISGRKAQLATWKAMFAQRDRAIYVRTPDTLTLSAVEPIAFEQGHWEGRLPDGSIEAAGSYTAKWRQAGADWAIEAELFDARLTQYGGRSSPMISTTTHFHLFETAHGFAGIAWRGSHIVNFRLPASTAQETERSLRRRLPDAEPVDPPADIGAIIDAAVRYFAGERVDFADVPVDLGPQDAFFAAVYDHVRTLGFGETTTYGAVARTLGAEPQAARDVGQVMANNPIPLIVPCHRVTAAGGKVGGFSAPGGSFSKARMLELEGVSLAPPPKPKPESAQAGFGF